MGCAAAARTWPARPAWGVARSYQQLEIPEPSARRVQHDLHRARCACGTVHVAARPPGVPDAAVSVGPKPARAGGVPAGVPARAGGAVPAAARRCGWRAGLGRVRPLLPGEGGRGDHRRGAADQDADHRRMGRRVRRDDPAGRAGRDDEARAGRLHRAVLGVLPRQAQPAVPSATSASCPPSPGSSCRTGTPAASTTAGSTWPAASRAWPTSCATTRTRPGAGRTRSGRRGRSGRCAASSRPGTMPATPALPRSPPACAPRWSASSATLSWPGCPTCPAFPGRRTPPPSTPAATCWSLPEPPGRRAALHHRHQGLAHQQHQ